MPIPFPFTRRGALTVAVLAGTLGAAALPAATASAATTRTAISPVATNPAARYAGQAVAIGQNMVAVLRDDPRAGGPEAWIRAVSANWKPGDPYMYRVLAKLDRDHLTARQRTLSLRLTGATGSAPALRVSTAAGGTRTFPLPKVGTPDARGCTIVTETSIGAGSIAVLSNGPTGPRAFFKDAGDGTRFGGVVDRAHPALPESAGFVARITDPNGPAPKLVTNMEGGGHPASTTPFPKPGCLK
ncbi:hypothetical protein ACF061_21570 [Streptomyces sp. NPDC015220]|uniref:hypothetical protein n=1 Tax=Streptomyces sp. NPDC015220 TaxID=3364947 RepID=UPI0036FCD2F8